ncbi:lipase family protein [Phormidesmis priestleyi]
MAKFNRRKLLLGGMATSISASAIAQSVQAQTSQQNPNSVKSQATDETVDAIFGSDGDGSITRRTLSRQPSVPLTSPVIAYDPAISKILIQCSQVGMEQFEKRRSDPRYDGSIKVLESYTRDLDRYTQVATFSVTLDATTTLLTNLGALGGRIARRIVNPTVAYIGFVLTSATHNIIVFRGTSNPKEWIANLQARQSDYAQLGVVRGKVHTGFSRLYEQLAGQVRGATNRFNLALPCFVAGHSLGGALATLATADLVQNRALKDQLRLYSYAAPRVGDLSFAQFLSTNAPNSYRIINLADIVPMVPPSNIREQQYSHLGQEWVFLDYAEGEVSLSHAVPLYRSAIHRQIETNRLPTFPTACR